MHEFVTDLKGPDQLADPRMKSVYQLWDQKKRQLGHYPAWADFSISEIAETMPHMAVVDYLPHEDRFRIRFSGSVYDTLLGRDVTGSYFDEMPDAYGLESRARRACTGNAVLIDGLPLTSGPNRRTAPTGASACRCRHRPTARSTSFFT